jgi:hypothetical protein
MSDIDLVQLLVKAKEDVSKAIVVKERIEMQILQDMKETNAEQIVNDTHTVTRKEKVSYNHDRLVPLLEMLPREELIDSGAFVPESTKIVPAKFNGTKLKTFSKRGGAIKSLIESSRVIDKTTLQIKEK